MDKETYIKNALETIKAKNLQVPFELAKGSVITNLDQYLNSLRSSYLQAKDPRIEQLFYDKIEHLLNL
ncbi:hypothetical protein ACPDHL_06500 [Myroides sp. C15-4]|uniref:hypothetical protein n=1 Tax=Myroides sp. C15-4 TaxID=3400532 RepID=UPI003D2F8287